MKNTLYYKSIFYTLFLLISFICYSQDYSKVDESIKSYPTSFSSPEKLALKINEDFSKEEEKARAIFTWIALNIKYDLNAFYSQRENAPIAYSFKTEEEKLLKQQQFRFDMAAKTLKTKKGVCENYSALFHTLCDLTGLKCIDIPGASKINQTQIGKLPGTSDHIWNAVKIGDGWRFIDSTWASGSVDGKTGKYVSNFNDGYFFTLPEVFFFNHFPEDERLLMIQKTKEDFAQLPLYYGGYIKANYEIVSPEKGVLSNAKPIIIPFKIIDLPENDKIGYVFSNENKFNEAIIKRTGNVTEFEVALDNKTRGYLTIYINNRSIVSYKISK